jgi:hypothetical protein
MSTDFGLGLYEQVVTVEEMHDGRTDSDGIDNPTTSIPFLITDASDEADALYALKLYTPGSVLTHERTLSRRHRYLERRVDDTTWIGRVVYGRLARVEADVDDYSFTFDTTGGTQHITQSLDTIATYGPDASDQLGGAIGFDGERVAGCDITVPVFNFTEVHSFDPDDVNAAYKIAVMELTGKTNQAAFRGFAAGEVLFLGASGSRHGTLPEDPWEITFQFAASKNKTGLSVGSITGIAKKGWEYLWVQYGEDVDATNKVLVRKPVSAYVEQVYEEGDFSSLNLGDDPS